MTHDYQEALALGDRIAVMREGRVVQIGTPDEIWRRPADTFVARSLGQPEINLLDGVVDEGRIRLGDGSLDVPVPAGVRCGRGDRVRVGLRPSDIHVTSGEGSLHGRVVLTERLGRNIELTVDVGGAQLIALTSGRHGVGEGDTVKMRIAETDVHVFTPGDGDTARLGEPTLEAVQ
ncbi:TOBE domain-containing protein [Mycobacterium sp. SMC-4]|uniref:TOBE domain-containing protein n=1 Tax=Mycobacterium sp. SMC-4 TaxID=2857059 RepID=UPI0037C9A9DF